MKPNKFIRFALWISRYKYSTIAIAIPPETLIVIGKSNPKESK